MALAKSTEGIYFFLPTFHIQFFFKFKRTLCIKNIFIMDIEPACNLLIVSKLL